MDFGRKLKDFNAPGVGIFTYVDEYKGVERLNICAHGVNPNYGQLLLDEPMKMYYNGKGNTPVELLATLKASNINPESYNNVRLLMCHSGNGGADSFGGQFGGLIKRNVKAFQGPVHADLEPQDVDFLLAGPRSNSPHLTEEIKKEVLRRLQPSLNVHPKKAPVPGDSYLTSKYSESIKFYYRPVKFNFTSTAA
ncbi:hypothetical protein DXV65_15435 [Pseudomonas fluorescens]|nr:hypothetical protein DXV65_15435 [Pseudomonas fluorescens]